MEYSLRPPKDLLSNIKFADIGESYYFSLDSKTLFLWHFRRYTALAGTHPFHRLPALDERVTLTARTQCSSSFCERVTSRDGDFCVATGEPKNFCDAVHIIPRAKGDSVRSRPFEVVAVLIRLQYIHFAVQSRRRLYSSEITIVNDVRNGMLLRKYFHSKLGRGTVAFVKVCDKNAPKEGFSQALWFLASKLCTQSR